MARLEKALAGLGQGLLQVGQMGVANRLETARQTALAELNARLREQGAQADFGRQQELQEDQQAFASEEAATQRDFQAAESTLDRDFRANEGLLNRALQEKQLDASQPKYEEIKDETGKVVGQRETKSGKVDYFTKPAGKTYVDIIENGKIIGQREIMTNEVKPLDAVDQYGNRITPQIPAQPAAATSFAGNEQAEKIRERYRRGEITREEAARLLSELR